MLRKDLGTFSGHIFTISQTGDLYIIERSSSGWEEVEHIIPKEKLEEAHKKLGEVFPIG